MTDSKTSISLVDYSIEVKPRGEAGGLAGEELLVRRLKLSESLSRPYWLEVELHTPPLDALAMEGFVAADVTLAWARDSSVRIIHGMVATAQWSGPHDDHSVVELTVVPGLALLDRWKRSRVFQDLSVPDIVASVVAQTLGEFGRSVDVSLLSGRHRVRDYCTQYDETDLDFIQRLLAEEGISFVFDHGDLSVERIVLLDDNNAFRSVGDEVLDPQGAARAPAALPVLVSRPELAEEEGITGFAVRRGVESRRVTVAGWDWKPRETMVIEADAEAAADAFGRLGEWSDFASRRLAEEARGDGPHRDETQSQSTVRLASSTAASHEAKGEGLVTSISAGHTFALLGHPDVELDIDYLITEVVHRADCPEINRAGSVSAGANYWNRFRCVPLESAYAPKPRPAPRVYGTQTALVVGPPGEEIHTDVHGRVQVRMHWDREQPDLDAATSCWLRVAQTWGGAGWGSQFIPRVGMEVLVAFIGGDPNRPLCVGCVYNGKNPPPYALPESKTQSGIKTRSSPGGDGFNELRFEDAAGSEEVYLHAQKNLRERVNRRHSTSVGGSQSNSVGGDQSNTVSGNQTNTVKKDQTETVTGVVTFTGEDERIQTLTGKETVTLLDERETTVGTIERHQVTGMLTQEFDGGRTTTVGVSDTETLTAGDKAVTITKGGIAVTASTAIKLTQSETHKLVLENGATLSTSGDFKVSNGKVSVTSEGGALKLTGSDELSLACGAASIVLKKDGTIDIQGSQKVAVGTPGTSFCAEPSGATINSAAITATAIGVHELKGALIKIN